MANYSAFKTTQTNKATPSTSTGDDTQSVKPTGNISIKSKSGGFNKRPIVISTKRATPAKLFNWADVLNKTFLSKFAIQDDVLGISNKYDLVYRIGKRYLCVLTEHQHIKVSSSKIPTKIINSTKQKLATKLTKRLQNILQKTNGLVSQEDSLDLIHHIGLTSITVDYQNNIHPIEHNYGSIFFQEDCVLDLDDERRVMQLFSLDSLMKIISLLQTPSDVVSFFDYHLKTLVNFDDFKNEVSLAQDFFINPPFYKRAYDVQKKLVEIGLLTEIESRLENAYHPSSSDKDAEKSKADLIEKLQTTSRMFQKLLNRVIKLQQADDKPLDSSIKMLLEESMYTRMSIMEEVIAHKHATRDELAQGYLCHQHSYNTFGHHFVLIIYGLAENAEYSRDSLQKSYNQLLMDINSQLQDPVMDEYFILGFDLSKSDDKGNVTVEMDVFHQSGSAMTVMERRLYEQVQALSNYQS